MNLQSIDREALLALHRECVIEYGGNEGEHRPAALDAALAYPMERALSGEADIASLAAAHAFGVLNHRPFADGNTRAAFLALGLFLYVNGWRLSASQTDAANIMLKVVTGEIDESMLTDWIRARL
ncbi:type II toxin-antitoxin system death-on-curing family toxin [Noviherbaspirillum cavernae]|uniref:Type II toxin-antitoxin system death-on-curing family toxin n=1 Tax=Noviherbaspirillum cavernae TaxID=2320862 RepID=A0A418X0Z4_9BURK|nr:type II toxin-antitoxin system death-on-curing family toxin [Noviherbaspirillum cavernae]RJG06013.1 type II toxin-antitoxin system death-on-curing family toxin [Noviherbaspirillum cavernae]